MISKNKKYIVMVGTSPNTQGGVATVVNVLKSSGLFDDCNIKYINSHVDGLFFEKIRILFLGLCLFVKLLLFRQVNLVHFHMASRASFWRKTLFILPSLLLKIPVVIHLHGAEFHVFYNEEVTPFSRAFIKYIFEKSDQVIVLSDKWKQWVDGVFPETNVKRIHNPIVKGAASSRPNIDNYNVLFLGRIGERKGAFDLILAMKCLKKIHPKIKLVMAGDGDIEKAKQIVLQNKIDDHVVFPGWVKGAAKQRLLSEASVYVLPSYNEGLPMSILEAMAAGLPIVSTPVGGIPEAVTNEVEGYLIPPGDIDRLVNRIDMILSDSTLQVRLGRAALAKVESSFLVEQIILQIQSVYRKLGAFGPGNGDCCDEH